MSYTGMIISSENEESFTLFPIWMSLEFSFWEVLKLQIQFHVYMKYISYVDLYLIYVDLFNTCNNESLKILIFERICPFYLNSQTY